jgi:hypothetical protein
VLDLLALIEEKIAGHDLHTASISAMRQVPIREVLLLPFLHQERPLTRKDARRAGPRNEDSTSWTLKKVSD